jgi:hypothetical protein
MKNYCKLTLFLTAVFIIVYPAFAEEMKAVELQATGVFTTMYRIEADDMEGHTFSVYEAKGAGKDAYGGFTFYNKGMSELVKGKGTHNGVNKLIDKEGHIRFIKWQGTVSPVKTPSGKSTLSFEGTWDIASGTGKWENSEGSGTYQGMFVGDGIYTWSSKGDYLLKKQQ